MFEPFLSAKVKKTLKRQGPSSAAASSAAAASSSASAAAAAAAAATTAEWPGQPADIKATLRDYQVLGLAYLRRSYANGVNAILADEMGLGKTLQSIALIAHVTYELKKPGAHLVVVPLSVMAAWMNELRRWCPRLRVLKLQARPLMNRRTCAYR